MGMTHQSVVLKASPDEVWKALRNFHDMSWATPIEKCEPKGDARPDQPGAKRVLNGAIHETLLGIDDEKRTIHYSIDQGPDPLSQAENYRGEVRVSPVTKTGGTFVEWSSRWDGNDGPVCEFCKGVYDGFLDGLTKKFG